MQFITDHLCATCVGLFFKDKKNVKNHTDDAEVLKTHISLGVKWLRVIT